ncbi:MAG: AbrB/MazE/SpoVT family DNA-binding domain-containing protein [Candidatus Dormibacteraeota bacterium]|nr:AbrB/MazE/SpoVT family DNA-binding domain-containing protein [Candidatus Dormibacteraeota bacterium]MBV8446169.1 AbrB/MazE/SpoVT family DNA-binding domain-containing protein [Candidatus Dormibacteraeota bacterium]
MQGKQKRSQTRIGAKHQVTIPLEPLRRAGLATGDRLDVIVERPGEVRLVRHDDPIERASGILTGVYEEGYLDKLRGEWD